MARHKKFLIPLVLLLTISSLFRTILLLWNTILPDFSVYYEGTAILLGGGNPYTAQLYTQLNYPPLTLFAISPITIFPYEMASNVWLLLSVISFGGSMYVIQRLYRFSFTMIVLLSLGTVLAFPFKFTLGMGQINLLLLLVMAIYLWTLERKEYPWASFFLTIATVLKVFPLLLLLPHLFQKRWRMLVSVTLALIGLSAFSYLFAPDATKYYVTTISTQLLNTTGGAVYYNQSMSGLLARMQVQNTLAIIIRYYLLLVGVYYAYRYRKDFHYGSILLLTTILVINNFTWQHHLVLLLLPFAYLLTNHLSLRKVMLLFIAYVLIAYNIKDPSDVYVHLRYGWLVLSHGTIGMMILWVLLLLQKKFPPIRIPKK